MAYLSGRSVQGVLPKEAKYFKEEAVCEILTIPTQKPDMERLLNVMVWPEVVDYKLVETPKGRSFEGQYLSGSKLVVEVKLSEKVTYVADEKTQSVHAAHYENMKSIFVILPSEIDGQPICDLLRLGKVVITPYVEDTAARMIDARTIHKCVLLFVDVIIC